MKSLLTKLKIRARGRGQVLVMYALMLVLLMGIAALAVDVGFILAERRGVQNAADATVMASARHMARGNGLADSIGVGLQYAEINGYGNGGGTSVIITSNDDRVEVEIEHEVESFFLQMLYSGDWSVSVLAEAEIIREPGPFALIALGFDSNCALGPNGSGIQFQGNANVHIDNGSIGSNSCIIKTGSGAGAGDVYVGGNLEAYEYVDDPGNKIEQPDGAYSIGGANEIPDPHSGVASPVCTDEGGEYEPEDGEVIQGEGKIFTPGYYNGNLPIPGGQPTVNLLPGVYCISGSVSMNGGLIRSVDSSFPATGDPGSDGYGGGVLLFFSGSGGFDVAGNAEIRLRAIGLLDPEFTDCTDSCEAMFVIWVSEVSCSQFRARGNSGTIFDGIIYAPCSHVTLGGTPGTEVSTGQVVGDSIVIFGNATFNLFTPDDFEGTPFRVFLVQ